MEPRTRAEECLRQSGVTQGSFRTGERSAGKSSTSKAENREGGGERKKENEKRVGVLGPFALWGCGWFANHD